MKTSEMNSKGTGMMAADNEEAGATDNQLLLDPNDKRWQKKLAGCSEGDSMTMDIECRMTSPGRFVVTAINECMNENSEAEADDEGEDESETDTKSGGSVATKGITNPAVIALIGAKR
jgi:hypothetical protein